MFIYLDESGDLGFDFTKQKTSKYFVITLLICDGKQSQDGINTAVKRTLRNKLNNKKSNKRVKKELKGSNTSLAIKQYFAKQLPEKGYEIYSVALNKTRVNLDLRSKSAKKKLYNFLSRFILEKVCFSESVGLVSLVVDKCKNKPEMRDFNSYLENQLEALLPLNVRLNIDHLSSEENSGLQAVDMFCWGISRRYAFDDYDWYSLYKGQVVFDTVYLPDNPQEFQA